MTDNRDAAPMAAGVLEPCPFCSKTVAVVTTASEMWPEHEDEGNAESYAVMCDAHKPGGPGGCGASGGFAFTEAEAIALWNQRASPTPTPQAPAGQGWKWMKHPDRNDGNPIPVQFFTADDGAALYRPFDEDATDFEVSLMSSEWCEVASMQAEATSGAGWKLVPVEPTDEMETAGENDYEQTGATFPSWKSAYRAMLAAAPQAPAPMAAPALTNANRRTVMFKGKHEINLVFDTEAHLRQAYAELDALGGADTKATGEQSQEGE